MDNNGRKRRLDRGTLHRYALTAVSLVMLLQGCAALNPKALTRDRARDVIQGSKEFKTPVVIPLQSSETVLVDAASPDEPEPTDRAVETFYQGRPATALLRHLGLVEEHAAVRKRPQVMNYTGAVLPWHFAVETNLTEKGKEVAAGSGSGGNAKGVPIFKRAVVEVTALSEPQGGRAQADFTWKRVPTAVGEALDQTKAAYQSLPPELQRTLGQPQGMAGTAFYSGGLLQNYDEIRKGIADLQLYDDGWRVTLIRW